MYIYTWLNINFNLNRVLLLIIYIIQDIKDMPPRKKKVMEYAWFQDPTGQDDLVDFKMALAQYFVKNPEKRKGAEPKVKLYLEVIPFLARIDPRWSVVDLDNFSPTRYKALRRLRRHDAQPALQPPRAQQLDPEGQSSAAALPTIRGEAAGDGPYGGDRGRRPLRRGRLPRPGRADHQLSYNGGRPQLLDHGPRALPRGQQAEALADLRAHPPGGLL